MKAAFGDPRIAYHGTKSQFVQPILDNGFRNAGVANYGPGIYFAKTKEHAASYGTSIFECEVFGTARTRSKGFFRALSLTESSRHTVLRRVDKTMSHAPLPASPQPTLKFLMELLSLKTTSLFSLSKFTHRRALGMREGGPDSCALTTS